MRVPLAEGRLGTLGRRKMRIFFLKIVFLSLLTVAQSLPLLLLLNSFFSQRKKRFFFYCSSCISRTLAKVTPMVYPNSLSVIIGVLACILGWRLVHLLRWNPSEAILGSGAMFNQIATYYDITNRYMSLGR